MGYCADFEGDGNGGCEADSEAEIGQTGRAEAGLVGIDFVFARGERGSVEEAGGVSCGSGGDVGFEIADGD